MGKKKQTANKILFLSRRVGRPYLGLGISGAWLKAVTESRMATDPEAFKTTSLAELMFLSISLKLLYISECSLFCRSLSHLHFYLSWRATGCWGQDPNHCSLWTWAVGLATLLENFLFSSHMCHYSCEISGFSKYLHLMPLRQFAIYFLHLANDVIVIQSETCAIF